MPSHLHRHASLCIVSCRLRLHAGCAGRHGLTLVEVVVALTLAATLLVGMLTAFRVHQRQLVRASEERLAVDAVEPLVADWMASEVPREASGQLNNGRRMWRWQLHPVQAMRLDDRGVAVEIVRLEVFPVSRGKPAPVLTIELMRPVEQFELRERRRRTRLTAQ